MKCRRRIVIVVVLILACLASLWLVRELLREHGTYRYTIVLGGQKANVAIRWSRDRVVCIIPHTLVVGGGRRRYDVVLDRPFVQPVAFRLRERPYAIWLLNGELYVVSMDLPWNATFHIERIDASGKLQSVRREELPIGPKPFNLTEDSATFERAFRMNIDPGMAPKG